MLLLVAALTVISSSSPGDALAAQFRNPPASARPHTWWHWMNGNVTKEGITADLEAMKEAGIGGAQMFTVDQSIPAGKVGYNSPLWREMVVYATKEASRLGIELCLHNCAGWSSSGGPWITPENAMQVIAWSSVAAHGPSHFSATLPPIKAPQVYAKVNYSKDLAVYAFRTPAPVPRDGHFLGKTGVVREDGLTVDLSDGPANQVIPGNVVMLKVDANGKLDWDVPAGDWTILRVGHVPTGKDNHPAPPEGDGLEVDKLSRSALDAHWAGMMAKVIEECGPLAGKVLNNALIDSYEVGSQNWTPLMRAEFKKRRGYDMMPWLPVIAGFTVQSHVKSERFLWDLRKTIADLYAENYFAYFGDLCHKAGLKFSTEPYGNGGFDSITAGGTADIPMGEFWIGGSAMETTRVAASVGHIYGRPVIGAESFTADEGRGKWLEEPYGIKALGDQVFCNGINRYIFHRYAMQPWLDFKPGMTMGPWGTHLDRTQTWWTEAGTWLKYVARCQYLLQKGRFVGDTLYYAGENSPVDWIYGPQHNPRPPAGFDYDSCDATILERATVRNHIIVLPSGMEYKVLVLPDSKVMTVPVAEKIRSLVEAGATVVGTPPTQSPSLGEFPDGDRKVAAIAQQVWGDSLTAKSHSFGSGKVVWDTPLEDVYSSLNVAPDFAYKPLAGRAKLMTIHRLIDGADVYFVSNQNYQPASVECTFRVDGRTPELWHGDSGETGDAPVYRFDGGRTVVPLQLDPAESVFVVFRHAASGKHFVRFSSADSNSPASKPPVIVIQKARYETVNGKGADVTAKVSQMFKDGETEIGATNDNFGDPAFNERKVLNVTYTYNGELRHSMVEENDTLMLIPVTKLPADRAFDLKTVDNGFDLTAWKPGRFTAETSDGKKLTLEARGPAIEDLSTPWRVQFDPQWGGPPEQQLWSKLISWSDSPVSGIKYFSGSAVYSREFTVPRNMVGGEMLLDLGKVKNFATVTLNGKNLGVLWKEPFAVSITGLTHPGVNQLEIKVTNLWPNRIIGDEQLPPDVEWDGSHLKKWPDWLLNGQPRPKTGRYTFETWHYWNKDSKLLESGLIGPVTLKQAQKVVFRP